MAVLLPNLEKCKKNQHARGIEDSDVDMLAIGNPFVLIYTIFMPPGDHALWLCTPTRIMLLCNAKV